MNVEEFRDYCLSLPGVTEKMPFPMVNDPYSRDVLCFYVGSKWFCYVNIEAFDRCCLRSTPEDAEELRARYDGIRPAWHMNKRLWNDVYFNRDVPDDVIRQLVGELARECGSIFRRSPKIRQIFQIIVQMKTIFNCTFAAANRFDL